MIELCRSTIDKACKTVRVYLPSTFILKVFRDVTGDQSLESLPDGREFEKNILRDRKRGKKISLKCVNEMSNRFYEEQAKFLLFLKSLSSQSIEHKVVNKITLDEFVSKLNVLLLRDSKIKIENYEIIQKWVPNKDERDVFLNINVPDYIQDYFAEGLDCLAYNLHRSSILFCTFALEASLRYRYGELVDQDQAYKIRFDDLIKWGIRSNSIEENDFNRVNIQFIRKYRNDLAHCNMNKPHSQLKISRIYAKERAGIIARLIEFFVNNIFYYQ